MQTYTHSIETASEQTETRQRFAEIEQQFNNRAKEQGKTIQLVKTLDLGDMHNGPEDFEPETRTVTQLNLQDEFQSFFEMNHYDLLISLNDEQSELTIQTNTNYGFASVWIEQSLVCTVQ